MQEQLAEAVFYIKGTLKFRGVAITLAWIVCVAGWYYSFNLPDKYVSRAKVQIETGTVLQSQLQGLAVQSNLRAKIAIMRQLMFTSANLLEIARIAEIDTLNMDPFELERYLNGLRGDIKIHARRRSPFYNVSYRSKDPELAKKVVNAVLTVFSEKSQKTAYSDVDNAKRFIEEQINEYEIRLRNAEKAKEEFKRINFGMLPGENISGGVLGKIGKLVDQLEETSRELKEVRAKQAIVNKQMQEAVKITDTSLLPEVLTPEDVQINQLRAERLNLLLKYTEKHPQVIAIENLIDEWELRREEKKRAKEESGESNFSMDHPYIAELKKVLNEVEAQEASLNSRQTSINERITQLEEEQSVRLGIETELQNLNRDYSALTRNYNSLVQRRERIHISENVDEKGISVRFTVADPPNVPLKPTEPNRKKLYSIILAGSLGAGFGLAFLIYFVRPTFVTVKQVSVKTGLPILGGISMQSVKRTARERTGALVFYVSFCTLLFVYFCLMVYEIVREPDVRVLDTIIKAKDLFI